METFVDGIAWLFDSANWQGPNGVAVRLVEHVWLTVASVLIACALAIPVGLWLGHIGKGGALAINVSNVGRAVPVFAVLSILILTPLRFSVWSTIIALVLFAIPPVLTNTYVGMREVDRDVVDVARGMGMDGGQLLRVVELPLALPLLTNGVRLAAVQVVATATIAALVGGGGLGRIITSGFGRRDLPQIVAGAILVGVLALLVEGLMELVQRRFDPLRRARRAESRAGSDAVAAVTGS
ncbi:MAG: ABC transporter permease [Jiangellaceae bacterium]|nr:ABC transporter permease [Jiangellaceae bacterium]